MDLSIEYTKVYHQFPIGNAILGVFPISGPGIWQGKQILTQPTCREIGHLTLCGLGP